MKKRNWKRWAKAAAVRAVKTMAQTAAGVIGVAAVMQDVSWVMVGSSALLAGVLSVLTSVAGLPEVEDE
ncbi:holin [Ruminococcus sp.]|uniref:holin n=1 Tax=Ruminococcus sp. TaxID=41978 RepID=UPI00300F4D0D